MLLQYLRPCQGLVLALLCVIGLTSPALAQDPRGSIAGRVVDSSGGALPGTTVTVTNTATGTANTAVTNEEGGYSIPFITPGSYDILVELTGFKRAERKAVEVRIADRLELDFKLEIGGLEETITVEGGTPLLDTRSASQGQVIDEKRIEMMPLSDGNPFTLTRLAAGTVFTGDLKFARPFDNGGTSATTSNGAAGGNEFTLDGSPNMANGRRVAFTPPAGAVQEFKVETATFDAQQGHTAGATINVTMKAGTNQFHGDGYYHYRDETLAKNDFFLERAGRPKDTLEYKRFGGTFGGPVDLGFYNGRNKTFFFSAFEWLYDQFPEPTQVTVPSEAQRNGDFSALLPLGIQIFDPATAQVVNGQVRRTAFPGNIIPANRINNVAREILKYYPLPNQQGNAQGQNNYIANNPRGDDFYSMNFRGDHQFNNNNKMFARYSRNNRTEYRGAWTGEQNGVTPTGNYLFRINDAVTGDHVWTMSPTTVLNLRGSWSKFQEPSKRQHQDIFDPASLGFSSQTTALFPTDVKYFPRIQFPSNNIYEPLGDSYAGGTNFDILTFQPTVTKFFGNHSVRAGYDFRRYRQPMTPSYHAAGRYEFGRDYTNGGTDLGNAVIGQELAAFLLGLPSGTNSAIEIAPDSSNTSVYQGVFVQDDWKVNSRLTVNLGLRYEYEGAPTEADNANVRGFDPTANLNVTAAARAAYAQRPVVELPASQFNPVGGVLYATDSNPGFWNTDKNNWQPRVSAAYQMNDRTVVRGGWAIYTVPFLFDTAFFQPGYAQSTPVVASNDSGLTFQANLTNPFPGGVTQPAGNSNGVNTFVGQNLSRYTMNVDASNGQAMRWAISVQHEIFAKWVVEAGYTGNHGYDISVDTDINQIPVQFLSTSPTRDAALIANLAQPVANPFAGLLPGTGLNTANVARSQLLRPFPQFTQVQSRNFDGTSSYQSGQFRLERRFSDGYSFLATYTASRFTERASWLNAQEGAVGIYEERPSTNDVPHRVVLNGILELPFGNGRRWGNDWNGLLNAIAGGWNVSAIWQWQTGRPLNPALGNVYYNGDINQLTTDYSVDVSQPVFDVSGFYFSDIPESQRISDPRINLEQNYRTLPSRPAKLRGQQQNLLDMSVVKRFDITQTVRAQLHLEVYNAFNQVFYGDPEMSPRSANFGKVTSQSNVPLNLQIGFRVSF
ncbi:Outer membrane receptor for ferrienterochelin and colicins [Luteitalea pratensis]|uniref:Outer membrane receptor for ferrienterochelin and colicins n=2 Tax=Luteitalea pratensis TaxID=1855912 RepID=A0A143PST6_LUTPR|nr:Outer membrane receptor for ferrienterochelin and colicins [Luteitalea pratensis]